MKLLNDMQFSHSEIIINFNYFVSQQ